MTEVLRVLGMDLPIIADLPDGYTLVAHENGPAIATKNFLSTLDPPLNDDDRDIPTCVYAEAIREYVDWSWPFAKGSVEWPDSGTPKQE